MPSTTAPAAASAATAAENATAAQAAMAAQAATAALRVDPALAETAVFWAHARPGVAGSDARRRYRRRRDSAYASDTAREREAAFARIAVLEFEELGLAGPLFAALRERPALDERVTTILVADARTSLEEGVTCDAGGTSLGFRVDAPRFSDPPALLDWARHVLGHAEDTLDPAFGFEPGWDGRGARRLGAAASARLHRLWDVTVDARLAGAGHLPPASTRAGHCARIAAELPGVDAETVARVVDRLWDGPRPTFDELRTWAVRPADLVAHVAPGSGDLLLADRCPLCGFPSFDLVAPEPALAVLVANEYPDWQPMAGLCGRCADRYRLRSLTGRRT
jgi:hypothetical protein